MRTPGRPRSRSSRPSSARRATSGSKSTGPSRRRGHADVGGPRDDPPGAEQGRAGSSRRRPRPSSSGCTRRVPGRATASWTWASAGFAVVRADTVLEVREALVDAETLARPTVVLTRLEQGELGQDVVARLARGKLFPVDAWEGVKGLFEARQLDPSLRDALPGPGPAGAPPPGGRVSPGPGRRARRRHGLAGHLPPRLRHGGPRARPARPAPLGRGTAPARAAISRRPAEPPRRRTRPPGRDARAGGRVDPRHRRVGRGPRRAGPGRRLRGRLRRGGPTSPPSRPPPRGWSGSTATGRSRRTSAGSWPAPGADALDDLDRDGPGQAQAHLLRADALLREVQAAPFAHLGRLTPLAWEAPPPPVRRGAGRRDRPPRTRPPWPPAEDAALRVADHAHARQPAPRTSSSGPGWRSRLARWLRTPEAHEGSFAQLARRYRDEVAFVGPGPRRPGRGRRPGRAVRRLRPARAGRGRPPGGVQPGVRRRPWPTGPAAARTPARCSASRTSLARAVGPRPGREGPRPAGRARRHELARRPRAAGRPAAAPLGRGVPAGRPAGRRPRSSPRSPASPSVSRTSLLAGLAGPGRAGRRAAAVPGRPRAPGPVRAEPPAASCSTRAS